MTHLKRLLPAVAVFAMSTLLVGCGGPNLFERMQYGWYYGFCSTVIVILDIIALVEIIGSDRAFSTKALWSLLIIFLPVLGLILYWIFER
jgi:hypothetical protein